MKKLLIILLIIAAVAGLIFAFIAGRAELTREREGESPVKAPTRVSVVGGENVVTLEGEYRSQSGVEIGMLRAVEHRTLMSAFGVVIDPQELIDLRGQLETLRAQLNKARAALDMAHKEFARQKVLHAQGQNVSEKLFQEAEGAFLVEQSNVAGAQAQWHAIEAAARQRWGAVIGQAMIDNAPAAERFIQNQDVLLYLTIPNGLPIVEAPPTATVRGVSGSALNTKFISTARRTDPKIQGRSFFYVGEAKETELLPGMNVEALLPIGEAHSGVVVPGNAIVWLHGKAWAYVECGEERFTRREIATDEPEDDGFFQPADFAGNRRIVLKGAQVLLSEEFRAQIQIND